ncbi:unnamed protein product [Medioppia subpectinata]|uniref:Uncharacterized protein n=1 Tax=Medioppia subpectinata TaxID=1979941 RepID=A0A7R9QC52_9ACAR|nr:unnamed protein product [Medioppia subpectinata]CAG2118095.1 unnamed protein product [Medioppia subpectinata]
MGHTLVTNALEFPSISRSTIRMSSSADRPRVRSSTFGSLQTLTRALRESLRLRKLRKQKRLRNEANSEQMRRRSKSVGNAFVDDEISDKVQNMREFDIRFLWNESGL